ncbi:MAG: carboxypeptidase-like regulatory domain-containing protein [Cytophagales bacterium]|nr:carboxypeptidase-like regulatory domain-containing protein [Cytophagales bacterium]
MNKFLLYFFLLFGLLPAYSFAQSDSLAARKLLAPQDSSWITVSGVVREKGNFSPISFVHVINKTQKKGTVTDDEGLFRIRMLPADTVTFSYVGYKTFVFVLDGPPKSDHYAVQIEMSQESYELSPLTIYPFPEEAEFKRQIIEAELEVKEKKVQGVVYGDGTKKSAVAYASPVSAIAFLFSKERKLKKRLKKARQNYEDYEHIQSKFNEKIVSSVTGLKKEEDILEFMRFCNYTNEYLLKTVAYDLLVDIEYKKSIYFSQHPEKMPADPKAEINASEE